MGKDLRALGAVLLAVAGVIGLSSCGLLPEERFEDDAEVSKKITSVRVDSDSGGVTLRGRDGSRADAVSVHREVAYKGDEPEGATHRVEDGTLVLGGCGNRCSVDYTVALPAGLPVEGQTSNGALRLSRVGKVHLSTDNGRVELKDVRGDVEVRTSDGRIKGRGLHGRSIRAKTSNGDIDLSPVTEQRIHAETSNGDISVTAPAGPYRVSAETSNGDKDVTVPRDADDGTPLDLTTSNGDITVKPRG